MFSYSKKLLFGDDRLLEFKRSATHGIARLWTQKAIPVSDHRYWSEYLRAFDSSSDVFSLLGVADIRRALVAAPENVCTLVEVLTLHLESLRDDPLLCPFPDKDEKRLRNIISGTGNLKLGVSGIPGFSNSARDADEGPPRDRVKELLNCCRILTRILPILMEGDHDAECTIEADGGIDPNVSLSSNELEDRLLWERKRVTEPPAEQPTSETAIEQQFVIDDDVDDETPASSQGASGPSDPLGASGSTGPSPADAEDDEDEDLPPSLGERLMEVAIDFLFYSGFTIPWTEELLQTPPEDQESLSRVNFAIWTSGVGSSVDLPGTETFHESHRITVLRLLLVLLSKSIYVPAQALPSAQTPALRYAVETLDRSVVLPLLCSLLNTIAKSTSAPGWMGGLMPSAMKPGTVKDKLSGVAGGSSKEHEGSGVLVALCLQTLDVLLSYDGPRQAMPGADGQPPQSAPPQRPSLATADSNASRDLPSARTVSGASTSSAKPNMFRFYISRLHRTADFICLWNGLAGILDHSVPSGSQIIPLSLQLPGSAEDPTAAALHVPETLMLLWSLLDHNPRFRNFVLDDGHRAPQLLCHLVYGILANKDNLAQQGLVRLCCFMLQDVSADRGFAVSISKAGSYPKGKLPSKFAPAGGEGSGADLLVQAVHHFLSTAKGPMASLYPPLVISLSNTSAFWRSLSVTSSSRLVQLLSSFSNAAFLLADDGNPRLLFYMLEALTFLVQYQYASNPNFIYALVGRSKPVVDKLAAFTLRKGIAEVRRVRRGRPDVGARLAETAAASTRRQSMAASVPTSPSAGSASLPLTAEPASLPQDAEKRRLAELEQATASAAASPAAEDAAGASAPSDRARGKMRQTSSSSIPTASAQADEIDDWVESLTEDELYAAAATVGRNNFIATEEWVMSWQKGLPLASLQAALEHLVPEVESFSRSDVVANKQNADARVLAFLREQSLKDVLPEAPPILTRPFQWSEHASIWLHSYLWGVIYVRAMLPLGIWTGTNTRLFGVKVQQDGKRRRSSGTRTASSGGGASDGGPVSPPPGALDPFNALSSAGAMVTGAFGSAIGGLGGVFGSSGSGSTSSSRTATPWRVPSGGRS